VDFIRHLQTHKKKVFYVSNNSTRSRLQYVQKLKKFGIDADETNIISSGWCTAEYFKSIRGELPSPTVLVVGEAGLAEELGHAGVTTVGATVDGPIGPVDAVVVGLDRSFTYARLCRAQKAIMRGARFIATNTDAFLPTLPEPTPGAGSIVAAVQTASRTVPTIIGKPSPLMFAPVLALLQAAHPGVPVADLRRRCIMVGDRMETDIAFAARSHIASILVLSGVTSEEEGRQAEGELRATWTVPSVATLFEMSTRG